jgi:hypothetical protein
VKDSSDLYRRRRTIRTLRKELPIWGVLVGIVAMMIAVPYLVLGHTTFDKRHGKQLASVLLADIEIPTSTSRSAALTPPTEPASQSARLWPPVGEKIVPPRKATGITIADPPVRNEEAALASKNSPGNRPRSVQRRWPPEVTSGIRFLAALTIGVIALVLFVHLMAWYDRLTSRYLWPR